MKREKDVNVKLYLATVCVKWEEHKEIEREYYDFYARSDLVDLELEDKLLSRAIGFLQGKLGLGKYIGLFEYREVTDEGQYPGLVVL